MDRFPEIETDRLMLGKLSHLDISKIVEYAGNKKVADNTLNIPHPYEVKDAIFWINFANQGFKQKTQYTFGIKLNTSNEFIGGIGLKVSPKFNRAELGYWIAEQYWNKGYATEALRAVLKFGFSQLQLNKIFALHLSDNPASGKVMIKNGMIKEGELKDHTIKDEKYKTSIQYRLTKAEFADINCLTS